MRGSSLLIAAVLGAAAAACGGGEPAQDPTFEAIVHDIFEPRCTLSGSCHTNPTVAARLDLTLENACDTLVNKPSCLFPDRMRIVPGHPEDSFFFHKLTGQGLDETPTGDCGTQTNLAMPFGASALSDGELALIHTWIQDGAQCVGNDKMNPPTDTGPAIASFVASRSVPLAGETFSITLTLDRPAPEGGQSITIDMDQNVISAPVQMLATKGTVVVPIQAYALRPTSRIVMRAHVGQSTKDLVFRIGGLEIAEVLADPVGIDDQLQWVKLHNTTTVPIDLNNYRFKAGQSNYDLVSMGLSGTIPAGGCAVVGGPIQSAANAEPIFSQAVDFSPDLPRGSFQAAGFAVFDNAPALNGVTTPVDTMLVGAGNPAKLLGPDAEIAAAMCNTPIEGTSALRTGPSTCMQAAMQPRTCP
jgi:hypothetical protein